MERIAIQPRPCRLSGSQRKQAGGLLTPTFPPLAIQDSGLLVVSDRSNARLQYVELNGSHRSTVDMSVGSRAGVGGHQPDNVDLRGSPSTSGKRDLLIPSLDGTVSVLAGDLMDVLSVMDVGKLLGPACPHPHDAIFLDNGDMVLCCWNPGHLSYWEKLPAEDVATA